MARTGMDRFLATIVMAAMLAAAGVLILASPASAAPGDLDPTFDTDGKQTTDFDDTGDTANDVAVQSDGKIVAVGEAEFSGDTSSGNDFALARYNADGSLDATFGGGDGKVTTNIRSDGNSPRGANDRAFAVAMQTVGGEEKIVVVGTTDDGLQDTALARYLPNGTLDDTFDDDGILIVDLGASSLASDVAIDGDGNIVTAGTVNTGTDNTNFSVLRFDVDGNPDTSFDGDGVVETDFNDSEDSGNGLALTPDGGIAVVGSSRVPGGGGEFALAKYTSDGDLDDTFGGGDGKVTTSFDDAGDEAFSVAVADNGALVVAGLAGKDVDCDPECESLDFTDFGIARYTSAGVLVPSFGGGDGKVTTDFNEGQDDARDVKIQADGKIVATGRAEIPTDCDDCQNTDFGNFGLARYNDNGSLDTSFGNGGKVQTSFFEPPPASEGETSGAGDEANGLAIQENGKIIAVGATNESFSDDPNDLSAGESEQDFALARYDGSGGTDNPPTDPPPGGGGNGRCDIVGTPDNDVLRGTPRRDIICGLGGNDVIRGMGGNDIIRGGPGNDVLHGVGGDDRLFGQAGNDVLRGGPGKDVLRGGPGKDSAKQ